MGRVHSKAHLRWPDDIAEHGQVVLEWALANSEGDLRNSPMSAACSLILANLREGVHEEIATKPDGRTVKYGVRIATGDPKTGEYLGVIPWTFDVAGIEAVWRFVSENAWQLYEGMEAMPIELTLADLVERTNTARVAMSRRADGVAVIRVRFTWMKRREKRNLRRDADPNDVLVSYDPEPAQISVWIGPNDEAKDLAEKEKAARHPLA